MPLPNPDQTHVEIIMSGTAATAGSNALAIDNVFHFRRTATIAALDKAGVVTAFNAAIGVLVYAALNVRYSATFVSCRVINDPTDQALQFANAGVGAIAGDSMPDANVVFLKSQTGFKGKSYRGNKKFGPISESDSTTTSDILNAGAITRFLAIAAAWLAGFTDANGNTWKPVVYSRTLSLTVVLPLVVATDISAIRLNRRITELNKRKPKSVYA